MNKYKLAVGRSKDGRKEIFILDNEKKTIYHCWEEKHIDYNPPSYSQWKLFGGHDIQDIAVGGLKDQSLLLGAIGGDKKVYLRKQIVPNGGWGDWICLEGLPASEYLSTSIAIRRFSSDYVSILTTNEDENPNYLMEAFVSVKDNNLIWAPRGAGSAKEPLWMKFKAIPNEIGV